jgi:hypothetical protein
MRLGGLRPTKIRLSRLRLNGKANRLKVKHFFYMESRDSAMSFNLRTLSHTLSIVADLSSFVCDPSWFPYYRISLKT